MCGIAGFLTLNQVILASASSVINSMTEVISHRGPNDSGEWIDVESGVALGHRRLSILDLSSAGHQPMVSSDTRFVIAFNGEIYNHLDLRNELEKLFLRPPTSSSMSPISWRGHSDSETLLMAFEVWGIEETLKKVVGMFAIALWDRRKQILTLARDRMGEKPLYYGYQGNSFLFGSELKCFKKNADFAGEIDREALSLYLRYGYIPAPHSIYKGIHKLLPGSFLQLGVNWVSNSRELIPQSYWKMAEVALRGVHNPFEGSDQDAVATLEGQLESSIKLQMTSDVPLGAFLSGGIDSSTIVSLMQKQSMRPIKTFTVGFDDDEFNEAQYAKLVAKHLGTDHTELYVSSGDAIETIPLLGEIYDEPFGDSSQIPTFLVSKLASKHVTVSLSGDGGDELFCGYNRYQFTSAWNKISRIPYPVRKSAGHFLQLLLPAIRGGNFSHLNKFKKLPNNINEKLFKLSSSLKVVRENNDLYQSLVSVTNEPEKIMRDSSKLNSDYFSVLSPPFIGDLRHQMMLKDLETYLPDDILVKVDRASMANSLETRVPFLDHRLIELAWQIPMHLKVRDGVSKWILRQVLNQYVPNAMVDRPKSGFAIPLGSWLRGPLREWAESHLSERLLNRQGYFEAKFVRKIWELHLRGFGNHQALIWNILMFQVWLQGAE